jgi:virulence-associated protein VagC
MPKVGEVSQETRRASLFRNGRNQALRIPKAFELPEARCWCTVKVAA